VTDNSAANGNALFWDVGTDNVLRSLKMLLSDRLLLGNVLLGLFEEKVK
jgi:hypothetical protein